jgi:hypothetical protein
MNCLLKSKQTVKLTRTTKHLFVGLPSCWKEQGNSRTQNRGLGILRRLKTSSQRWLGAWVSYINTSHQISQEDCPQTWHSQYVHHTMTVTEWTSHGVHHTMAITCDWTLFCVCLWTLDLCDTGVYSVCGGCLPYLKLWKVLLLFVFCFFF